jgi:5,10-methylenetetrahydromethanopterin reductase
MEVSCAFPTALDSPDNIVLAEQLGYHRAWIYDTPQQSPDVWMTLALAAQRTERIGLGPGVLVPSLRHPMVNAAATATLCALAPGRVAVAFGTGFTGRRAMGYPAIPWTFMESYIRVYRALLRGEVVEWEGDVTLSGTRDQVRRTLEEYGARGVTEVVFQPCGPDIGAELERFLDTARG